MSRKIQPLKIIAEIKAGQASFNFLSTTEYGFVDSTPGNLELMKDKINEIVDVINALLDVRVMVKQ